MMFRSARTVGALILGLLCAGVGVPRVSAQDDSIPDIVRRVVEKYYHPAAAGLRDLQVEVRSARLAASLQGTRILLYWKTPDRAAARLVDPPAALAPRAAAIEGQLADLVHDLVPRGLIEQVKESEIRVEEDGALTHLVLAPRRGSPDAGMIMHYWFDADLRLVRRITESVVAGKSHRTELTSITVDETDGHFFVKEMKGATPNGPIRIRWEYAKVGSYWLPKRVVRAIGDEPEEATEYVDARVDSGLSDDLFPRE